MSDHEVESIDLPTDVLDRVEERVPYTEFDSAGEYVTYVLEEVLHTVEESADGDAEAVDEQQVKDRLESLGYLNE